jgi:hypothetical protein
MTEPGKSSPPSQPKQTDASDASGAASASLADRRRKASVFQIETLSFPVGLWGIVGLLLYMLAFGFTATYTLVKIWPAGYHSGRHSERHRPDHRPPARVRTGRHSRHSRHQQTRRLPRV